MFSPWLAEGLLSSKVGVGNRNSGEVKNLNYTLRLGVVQNYYYLTCEFICFPEGFRTWNYSPEPWLRLRRLFEAFQGPGALQRATGGADREVVRKEEKHHFDGHRCSRLSLGRFFKTLEEVCRNQSRPRIKGFKDAKIFHCWKKLQEKERNGIKLIF